MDRTSNPYYGSGIHLDMRGSRLRSKRGIKIKVKQKQDSTDPMNILMKHVALGALANSSDRYDPPKCHPNTRVAILDSIDRWAHGLGAPKPILWLRGPLGAGKSAIAQTLAERLAEKFETIAGFFLSRTAFQRNQKGCIIPTIAYQLMLSIPELRPLIFQAIMQDQGLFKKDLRTQMIALIIQPLSAIQPDAAEAIKVVLIDGLDECCEDLPGQNYEAQQREILDAIAFAAQQPGMPLRFIVASRPELQITTSFQRKPLVDLTHKIILDDSHNPDADLRLYLDCKFEEMRIENPYIDSSWPPEDTISRLIWKSSGHFVYASVVVRQLEQPRQDPRETLKGILDIQGLRNPGVSPFAELDALYLHVMEKVSAKSLHFVTRVLEYLCFAPGNPPYGRSPLELLYNLAPRSPALVEKYLFTPQGQIYIHLADLHSVLDIPPHSASTTAPIKFIHASFNEFLTDRYRSGAFFIDRDDAKAHLDHIHLKHCYIEALNGYSLSTSFRAMLIEIIIGRFIRSSSSPSRKEFVEGVAALMGTNEIEFSKHVEDLGLSALQTEGNHRNSHSYWDMGVYATAYNYLQNCGIDLEKYGLKTPEVRDSFMGLFSGLSRS